MWVFKALSALCFLIGSMALVLAAVGTWFYLTINLIMSLGWFVGAIFMIGSLAALVYWENYVKAPFLFWLRLWQYADRMILDRDRTP